MYIVCTNVGVKNAFLLSLLASQTPLRRWVFIVVFETIIGQRREMREVDTAVIDNVFYHHRRREWLRESADATVDRAGCTECTGNSNKGCRFVLPGKRHTEKNRDKRGRGQRVSRD